MRYYYKNFCLSVCAFFVGMIPLMLSAQNNLKINFKDAASAPRNLVVCGDEATVTVTVSTEGLSASTRQNIQARLNLFKGVELVRFEVAGSSPGVSLTDFSNPNRPLFQLPNLVPSSSSSVDIQYVIKVNCNYTDSLTANDALSVVDKWDFSYDLGATLGVTESDFSTEYRDAIKVPFFTMSVSNNAPSGARVGQCYQRTVLINNSGLDGYIKGFVYTTSQGPGVSVKNITVNGVAVPYTKNPIFNTSGDTLIALIIPETVFPFNTRGSSGPADGDNLFEPDETVTIIEEICVANCDSSRISFHEMSWGCDARYCNTISRQDIVRLGQGSVNVAFQSSGSMPSIVGGYCLDGRQSVTFTNSGVEVDAGTGSMFDIQVGIGLSDSLKLSYAGYRILSIRVANINIPAFTSSMVSLKDNPLFTVDPDGAGGLSDIDGDGFYDDLAVGEKLEVTVEYEVDCSASLTNREDFCTNDFDAGFNARLDYTDLCLNQTTFLQPRFFNPVNSSDYIENCVDPDAKTDGTPFTIMHHQVRNVFNFERNCTGGELIKVAIKMPQGVTPIRDSMRMSWFEDNMPLVDYIVSNDTVYMSFDATYAQYLNGEYFSNYAFQADCTTPPGASAFPIQTAFYCPSCDCQHIWYCDTIVGPRIHYTDPPCVPNPLYDCAKGLKTVDFKAERTTIGYLDDTYTTKLQPDEVNTKVALSCDSIRMTVLNVVGATSIADSIGVLISYDNISSSDSNRLNDIFTFSDAQVVITHGGNTYNCSINATKMRAVRTDTTKAMYFDLHDCLVGLGIGPLSMGDSVNFIGNFSVNPEGPYKYTFEKVPNFRAFGYYVEDDSLYSCDNYGAFFRIGKSQALFSYPSSSSYPIGCSEANLEYKITMFNNDYYKYFGEEYRQAVGVDSIFFDFDPNFIKAFKTSVEISIADHPIYGDSYFALPNLDSTGRYSARFDSLFEVPSLNRLTSYAFNFRIKAIPNCATVTSSSNGDNSYLIKPTIYYRDRYYAKDIGDGSCSPYLRDTASFNNQKIVYSDPAQLDFTPITNPSIVISNDTADWTVKLCNLSDKGSAANSWLAIVPTAPGKNFRVISITDVTNNLLPINHDVKYYPSDSTKAFAFLNGLSEVTPAKTIDDVCNVVNIKAVVRECGTTEVDFKTGWLCDLPTDLAWTPTEYAPCADSVINAQVRTENPFIDANFINQSLASQPGICDTTSLEILLRNTDIGTAYDIKTSLTIPLLGASLIPSSIEVAYPSGAAYQPVTGAPTYVGMSQKGQNYEFANFEYLNTYLHQKGLKGFNSSNPNDSNEFKIRFKFTNDCDFKSGSLSYFSFVGKTVCGTPSNFELGESLPLEIQGGTLPLPKSYEVNMDQGNKLVAGGISNLIIQYKNLTITPSDTADEVSVKLPAGITYRPNSSVAITPGTWIPGEPSIRNVGGIQILTWFQPVNLLQNESATFSFSVATADTFACSGNLDMALSTLALKDLVCATNASVCRTEIITTSNGEHYYSVPLSRGAISIAANLSVSDDTIRAVIGDTIRLEGSNAQSYVWTDIDNGSVLGTDSVLTFVPTKSTTRISAKYGSTGGCLDSASVVVLYNTSATDSVPPVITTIDTLLTGRSSGDTLTSANCSSPITFTANSVMATDNLDANPTVTLDSTIVAGNCPVDGYFSLKTYRWTARDSAGNSSVFTIHVKIADNTPPVLNNVPNDIIISALDNLPTDNVTASDNCTAVTLTPSTIFTGLSGNDSIYVKYWLATDACGNVVRDSQIIVKRGFSTPSVSERRDTILVGDSKLYCLSNLNIPGTINRVVNTCPTTSNRHASYVVDGSNCLTMTGLSVGVDTACLTICTDSSYCVQVKFITEVKVEKVDSINITTEVGKSDTVCLKTTSLRGTNYTVTNICPDPSNTSVEYTVYHDTCVIIKGLTNGTAKSCWVVCDSTGKCDTTIINVIVNAAPITFRDTIYISDRLRNCFSTLNLKGNITSVVNNCSSTSNRSVLITVDSVQCVKLTGVTEGVDTACFTVCTDSSVCGTVTFYTTVIKKPITTDSIRINIEVGQSDTVCLKTTNLKGGNYTVTNICPDPSNTSVEYTIYHDTCVIIKGLTNGTAKSCWVVCDSTGKCDTTIITVTVNAASIIRRDTIYIGDSLTYCFSNLNLKGNITGLTNNCASTSNRSTSQTLVPVNCLVLKGVTEGIDTACYTVCTDSSVCGTVTFHTTVIKKPITMDSIRITIEVGQSDTVCLKTTNLKGGNYTVTNICPDPSNTSVEYTIYHDTCVIIKGLTNGTAKSCWVVCDSTGKCDTTIITVTVNAASIIRRDTIFIGDSIKYCLSDLNLKGTITSVVNNCSATSNRSTTLTVDAANCVILRGVTEGVDTACIKVCTDSSVCGNVTFYTTVIKKPTTTDSIRITIEVGQSDTVCLKTTNLKGPNYTVTNICPDASNTSVEYTMYSDTCVIIKGLIIGTAKSCWVVCDSTGKCDTTIINVTVNAVPIIRRDTIYIGDSLTYCFSDLNLKGNITGISNDCGATSNRSASLTLVPVNCVVFKGVTEGVDTACFTVCTDSSVCGKITFYTTVIPKTILTDTIINITLKVGESDTICLKKTGLVGSTLTLNNSCLDTTNTAVQYVVSVDSCIIIKGLTLGQSNSCWVLCDTAGNCITTTINTTVLSLPTTDTIRITVDKGKTDTLCLPFNRPRTLPIRNICPDSSGTVVQIENLGDSCLVITGKELGKEQSCWVICDTLSVCDTIIVVVTVTEGNKLPPIAISDTVTTRVNTMVPIAVTQNDTINGTVKTITLLTDPKNGTAVWKETNGIWILEYTPTTDFCNSTKIDTFIYKLCNDNGCDMAMIHVKVICDGLKIYNAISPNGDGKNDVFTIEGLENYSNTKILIYNRWGNKVYEDDNYQNNWGGQWRGYRLPDASYFYRIILENGESYSGYLQIHH